MDHGVRELSVREAAAACGVSESTIRRHLPALPGARRPPGSSRGWLIPETDLIAQGFTVDPPGSLPKVPSADRAALANEIKALRSEIADLEEELEEFDEANRLLHRRVEVAEAVCAEREQTIADLRLALARTEPPPSAVPSEAPPSEAAPSDAVPPAVPDEGISEPRVAGARENARARADAAALAPRTRQQRIEAARESLRRIGTDRH